MNRLLLLSALFLLPAPGLAQDAPLGRLFLTPEQRAALDNARHNKIRAETVAAAVVKKPKPPVARSVLINGVVKRSDGETIVWVNGKPVEGETPDGMQFRVTPESQGAVVVREPDGGRRVEIKVGQQVDLVTGRVQEPFARPRTAKPPSDVKSSVARPLRGTGAVGADRRKSRDDDTPESGPAEPEKPAQ